MNELLPEEFEERIHRLALGIEPMDAERNGRVASSLLVQLEGAHGLTRIPRHPSCVHALLESPGLIGPVPVRFSDASRRFVPRRVRVAFTPGTPTSLRLSFYPGAAYDVSERCAALRGRVVRGAPRRPMRWARLEARLVVAGLPGGGRRVGLAHGDDRGEFLLLIDVNAATVGAIVDPLPIELTAFGPLPSPPIPASPDQADLDPLWDLPVEAVPRPTPDLVSAGVTPPSHYGSTPSSTVIVNVRLSVHNSLADIVFQ